MFATGGSGCSFWTITVSFSSSEKLIGLKWSAPMVAV